jgi:hypothetical protein
MFQKSGVRDLPVRGAGRSMRSVWALVGVAVAVLACVLVAMTPRAEAGTYVINNCPSAGNGNAGPWTVYGESQGTKGTCSGGVGNWIGPEGANMPPTGEGDLAGVQVAVPGGTGITIREAKLWWYVPHQVSGATTYAIAAVNTGVVGGGSTPLERQTDPEELVFPSTTTEITLADYCSNSDAGNGCTFGAGENPNLELYGASLTLFDPGLPSGSVTGGSLSGTGPASGTASVAYNASDGGSGVRYVQLLLEGQAVATNDYIGECPYENFAACPANVSGTISWNTGSVADGQHEIALRVVNAGGSSTIVDDHTITTQNRPSITSPPTINGTPTVGSTLTGNPAVSSSNAGSGTNSTTTTAGQWLRCDSTGANCVAIPGATGTSYNLTPQDLAATIRYQETIRNTGGSTITQSAPLGPIAPSAAEHEKTEREKAEKEKTEAEKAEKARSEKERSEKEKEKEKTEKERIEKEKIGTDGTNGANGAPGGGGTAGVTVLLPGSSTSLGSVLVGTTARWALSLKVSPLRVRRGTTIRLTGTVSTSPRPGTGKLVFLQARSRGSRRKGSGRSRHEISVFGKWVTFQEFRANADGSFSSTYKFRLGGHHAYQFQAVAPAEGQFRNPTGTSRTITVKET